MPIRRMVRVGFQDVKGNVIRRRGRDKRLKLRVSGKSFGYRLSEGAFAVVSCEKDK